MPGNRTEYSVLMWWGARVSGPVSTPHAALEGTKYQYLLYYEPI